MFPPVVAEVAVMAVIALVVSVAKAAPDHTGER